jgi:amino acid adenylation domain-containing protein
MFDFQNAAPLSLHLADLHVSRIDVELAETDFDLTFAVYDLGKEMPVRVEYNTDLFDDSTIERMLGNFENLLRSVAGNPEQQISTLTFLSESELQKLLVEWNDGSRHVSHAANLDGRDQTAHRLFELCADRYSSRSALVFGEQQLTYQELNERANQLAHYLMKHGVGPETFVGICVERSTELIVGLLGILKAGGAYVPLDPDYPKERLSFMLQDTAAPVLLAKKLLVSSIPDHNAKMILLDQDWDAIGRESKENPDCKVLPDNLAYVIYTSGSTGKPKGVMIQHRSLVNYIKIAGEVCAIRPEDRVLQFASINFDASAEEIYSCLSCGATLVLRNDAMMGSPSVFFETCKNWQITVLDVPTAYWHELVNGLEAQHLELPASIRIAITGGEKALPDRLAAWYRCVDERVRLMNTYGPTEATIASTICELTAKTAVEGKGREVPIGSAIPNTQAYVLDTHLQPVPIGIPGELFVGGAGLARGYLNNPERTSEVFLPNPFSAEPGARMYKTGDRVRFLSDGNIEFIGRVDHQVKIRGFRIELGEIEAMLDQHPGIQASVVITREDRPGDKRLAAYFVPGSTDVPHSGELRKYLKAKLPDYMVPSFFVELNEFPLTPNGKIDRKKLPEPDGLRTIEEDHAAPSSPMEKMIAAIWQEVLGVDHISALDNFFDLGGHSLLSMKVIHEIERKTGKRINPRAMVIQTLAEVAASCEAAIDTTETGRPKGFTKKLFSTIKETVTR